MYVMVLNDGETYTDLEGCKIIRIPANLVHNEDELDEYVKEAVRKKWIIIREFDVTPRHGDYGTKEVDREGMGSE